jgi:hypothetical protein
MKTAITHTSTVRLASDGKTVEVVARVLEGHVEAGMALKIELNRSTAFWIPILRLKTLSENEVELTMDCEDDPEFAQAVVALNFADEILLCENAK